MSGGIAVPLRTTVKSGHYRDTHVKFEFYLDGEVRTIEGQLTEGATLTTREASRDESELADEVMAAWRRAGVSWA